MISAAYATLTPPAPRCANARIARLTGLAALGIQPERRLMITAAKEKDLLWTLEEAVASGVFGAVIGSLGPRERLYGFSASRRLKLRAAASRTPLFLLRHRSNGGATAVQGRWRASALPSRSEGEHAGYALLGAPRLRLTLERMGGLPPQSWEMGLDGAGAALLETGRLQRWSGGGKLNEPGAAVIANAQNGKRLQARRS